jgi:hypothetical protein
MLMRVYAFGVGKSQDYQISIKYGRRNVGEVGKTAELLL